MAASMEIKPVQKNIISLILLFKCLQFKEGLREHGLGETLNDKGCGGDIRVFNETEPSSVQGDEEGMDESCLTKVHRGME